MSFGTWLNFVCLCLRIINAKEMGSRRSKRFQKHSKNSKIDFGKRNISERMRKIAFQSLPRFYIF